MQNYGPLWPQHRLSSSLVSSSHKYNFSPILDELPENSKIRSAVSSKIMNLIVDVTKDLMQEKVDLAKELTQEIGNVKEKKEREKSELSINITNLKNDLKYRTELLLRSKRMCNVRGALEFIRSMVTFCVYIYIFFFFHVFCNDFCCHILFTHIFSLNRFGHRTRPSHFVILQIMF